MITKTCCLFAYRLACHEDGSGVLVYFMGASHADAGNEPAIGVSEEVGNVVTQTDATIDCFMERAQTAVSYQAGHFVWFSDYVTIALACT